MDLDEKKYFFGAKGKAFENARYLRHVSTEAERVLWEALRNNQLNGIKFRRQYPLGKFIVDFYCPAHHLVIEVDGAVHDKAEVKEYDIARSYDIERVGVTIIRLKNEEVISDVRKVLRKILETIEKNQAKLEK